jgi:transcriptional regulator with XRE-family HTH domain
MESCVWACTRGGPSMPPRFGASSLPAGLFSQAASGQREQALPSRGMPTVGDRIRQRRLELGLTQRELATEGVSYAYVSRLEANTRWPSVKALRALAPRLGVSVHWLETGEQDPAEELARLVIASRGEPPSRRAVALARAVLSRTK